MVRTSGPLGQVRVNETEAESQVGVGDAISGGFGRFCGEGPIGGDDPFAEQEIDGSDEAGAAQSGGLEKGREGPLLGGQGRQDEIWDYQVAKYRAPASVAYPAMDWTVTPCASFSASSAARSPAVRSRRVSSVAGEVRQTAQKNVFPS